MITNRFQVNPDMSVVGANGKEIGTVKTVRGTDFLVNRSMHRDVYVPFDAIKDVSGNVVTLNVTSDQIGDMNWAEPPIAGGGTETTHTS